MKTKIIITAAALCGMLALCSCSGDPAVYSGQNSMDVPETQSVTVTATFSDGEATQGKNMLSSLSELTSPGEKQISVTSVKELKEALFSDCDEIICSFGGEKSVEVQLGETDKKIVIDSSLPQRIALEGKASVIEIKRAAGYVSVADAISLVVANENASVDVRGTVSQIYITGKNATVQLYGSADADILLLNSTAKLINSAESACTVCLSNGVQYSVGPHETYDASVGTVSAHK